MTALRDLHKDDKPREKLVVKGVKSLKNDELKSFSWDSREKIDSQRAEMDSAPTYKYNRRSLRLKHYDYSRAGFYFITICTQGREYLFGEILDDVMVLSLTGEMVSKLWDEIMDDFPNVHLHEFVIMPNHIHGIIEIMNNDNKLKYVGVPFMGTLDTANTIGIHDKNVSTLRAPTRDAPTVGNVIGAFKSMTTNIYIKMVKNGTLQPFNKRIWQRNYHEYIIRNDADYIRVAEYTLNNPLTWEDDVLSKP